MPPSIPFYPEPSIGEIVRRARELGGLKKASEVDGEFLARSRHAILIRAATSGIAYHLLNRNEKGDMTGWHLNSCKWLNYPVHDFRLYLVLMRESDILKGTRFCAGGYESVGCSGKVSGVRSGVFAEAESPLAPQQTPPERATPPRSGSSSGRWWL
jgi:hypothetical protein